MGAADKAAAEPPMTTESWSEKDQQIQVAEDDGSGTLRLGLRSKVAGHPLLIYQILTDPAAVDVFRGIKACNFRKLVEENKSKTRRQLEVSHLAFVKFLFVKVTFETRLKVWEDDENRKIRFCNANDKGFMKTFEGTWHIQEFSNTTLRSIGTMHGQAAQPRHVHMPNPFGALQQKFGFYQQQPDSLVTLQQAILPKQAPPPGLKGLMRRLCAKQLQNMMEDLRDEVDRREGGAGAKPRGKSGKRGNGASPTDAAPAACATLSQPACIWDHIEPIINIAIQL